MEGPIEKLPLGLHSTGQKIARRKLGQRKLCASEDLQNMNACHRHRRRHRHRCCHRHRRRHHCHRRCRRHRHRHRRRRRHRDATELSFAVLSWPPFTSGTTAVTIITEASVFATNATTVTAEGLWPLL